MAEVISLKDLAAARRRAQRQEHLTACVEILEESLREALRLFKSAPTDDRSTRARQVRQLAEILEYVVRAV